MDNGSIAQVLGEIADLLEIKGDNAFKIRAYRSAADTISTTGDAVARMTDTQLRAHASTATQERTYTCVPPGSGVRVGIDRDEDGFFDRDEIDGGSDPADPGSTP